MKTRLSLLLVGGILLATALKVSSQPATGSTFTRITTGPIATDAARSFGCAWGDYDGDGFLDLIVGNGFGDANALYHNSGDGSFTRVTTGPIATEVGDASGCVWGDFNNDGNLDLFVANWQLPSFLFRNDGGGDFTRIVNGSMGSNIGNSTGCSWGDYDNDGLLDLVVANNFGDNGVQNEFLYRNDGNGEFTQILDGPIPTRGGNSGGSIWSDYDGDGLLDLLVSNNEVGGSFLFHNDGAGNFRRVTTVAIGRGEGGCDWGDYDNDGDLDLFVSGRSEPDGNDWLYRNDGDGAFTRITSGPIPNSGGSSASAEWGDYDNDGWLDLVVVNHSGQKNFLFHNDGNGAFTRVTAGSVANDIASNSLGCAWGDYDNDGFLDLFVSNGVNISEPSFLYHNNGNSNRWLSIVCAGRISNRSGIGAKVRVKTAIGGAERWQLREITSGGGYNGSRLRGHFGLGDATNAALVRIEWPSGTVQELRDVAVNQLLIVKEPPVLTMFGLNGASEFQFHLKGGRGVPYTVEYSTNLVHWNWLESFTAEDVLRLIRDSGSVAAPQRFYRARETD